MKSSTRPVVLRWAELALQGTADASGGTDCHDPGGGGVLLACRVEAKVRLDTLSCTGPPKRIIWPGINSAKGENPVLDGSPAVTALDLFRLPGPP